MKTKSMYSLIGKVLCTSLSTICSIVIVANSHASIMVPTNKLVTRKNKKPVVLVAVGSFSPITNQHVTMMERAKEYLESREPNMAVIGGYLSPVSDAYQKKELAPSLHRIAMAQAATKDSPWLMVSAWEAQQPKHTPTLDVLKHIKQEVEKVLGKEVRVMLVCGADLLETFNTPGLWSTADQKALSSADFGIIAIPRKGSTIHVTIWENDTLDANKATIYIAPQSTQSTISSSELRKSIAEGKDIKNLTPDAVVSYIKKHKLFEKAA